MERLKVGIKIGSSASEVEDLINNFCNNHEVVDVDIKFVNEYHFYLATIQYIEKEVANFVGMRPRYVLGCSMEKYDVEVELDYKKIDDFKDIASKVIWELLIQKRPQTLEEAFDIAGRLQYQVSKLTDTGIDEVAEEYCIEHNLYKGAADNENN